MVDRHGRRSTFADVRPVSDGPTGRWFQRGGLVVLLVIVVAGALGAFGVHSRTTRTHENGYTLTVTYAQSARAGWDVPFRMHVHHPGGFGKQLTIGISLDYFQMFETQGFFPDPDSAGNDGHVYQLTYDSPSGDDFEMDYDAYIQPSAQIGKSANVEVTVDNAVVARTSLHTWLVP
jgi:hypothetical protein